MRLLITGNGKSGSWKIRGEQIGRAIGATINPSPTLADCKAADVILVVKRTPAELLDMIRKSGRPFVYDIVDAYPQPMCSSWSRKQSIDWLRKHIAYVRPDFMIWPNARMQADFGNGGAVVYHHHRPDIRINPIRKQIAAVGYEGSEKYLEGWRKTIDAQCARRGWRFVVNPEHLADVDIVLALRGAQWNGYAQQHWKSNIKLANAQGSGTPFIGMPEDGYIETARGGELFVSDKKSLGALFDFLTPVQIRREIFESFRAGAIGIDAIAKQTRDILCALKS